MYSEFELREDHPHVLRLRRGGAGPRLDHGGADGGAAQEQAVPRQFRQRLTHRRAGDADPVDELRLGEEGVAIGEVALDDLAQRLFHLRVHGRSAPPVHDQIFQDF